MNRTLIVCIVTAALIAAGAVAYTERRTPNTQHPTPRTFDPSQEARLRQLEVQVEDLRRRVNPTDDERRWMVRDPRTGMLRPLVPGEIGHTRLYREGIGAP